MLKIGKHLAAARSKFKEGFLHKLPLVSGKYDLALCSLALHLLAYERKEKKGVLKEREAALREISRVLGKGGYFIGTVPPNCISENDAQRFYDSLGKLGFETVKELSGYVKAKEDKKFRVYVVAARKTGEPQKNSLDGNLKWCKDRELVNPPKYKVIEKKNPKKKEKTKPLPLMSANRIKCEKFVIAKAGAERSLDEAIDEYIKQQK